MKSGKAVAYDGVGNDIIKACADLILPILVPLFNKILQWESFPSPWILGIITPIFKAARQNDVNNYRGITVNSCLSKLFMMLLNDRLQKTCDDRGIIHYNQIGFRKGFRPSDHVFTLKTLIP